MTETTEAVSLAAALATVNEFIEAESQAAADRMVSRPSPLRDGDEHFVALASEVGIRLAPRSAAGDVEGRFVRENLADLREAGYLGLPVPSELGGAGATLRQLCYAQSELARHCSATALAVSMHVHEVLSAAWRWRQGDERERAVLERVAAEGLVLASSVGTDGVFPSGLALREGNGYRVNARKRYCSGSPAAGLLTTSAFTGEYDEGAVIEFRVPLSSPGVEVVATWDGLGMRASGSDDVTLTDVWVPAAEVLHRRQWGELNASVRLTLMLMNAITSATYHGIAAGARDIGVEHAKTTNRGPRFLADLPEVRRQVGLMDYDLRTAWWSLLGMVDQLGENAEPNPANVALAALARRCVVRHSTEVVDLAMDVVGGASYLRGSPLERAYRDVRAAPFHAMTPEAALSFTGKVVLGRACRSE